MKTVFDIETRAELSHRINSLAENSTAQWGKMNLNQMLRHCILWDEMILKNKKYNRVFIGVFLGKMMLKNELKRDTPMRRNNPSIPELIVTDNVGNINDLKSEWISGINDLADYAWSDDSFIHPFFGKMTREQIGHFDYKHADHHLRQFGA